MLHLPLAHDEGFAESAIALAESVGLTVYDPQGEDGEDGEDEDWIIEIFPRPPRRSSRTADYTNYVLAHLPAPDIRAADESAGRPRQCRQLGDQPPLQVLWGDSEDSTRPLGLAPRQPREVVSTRS